MNCFSNYNIPGFVDQPCYTAFYSGDVDCNLILPDGSTAQVLQWNPDDPLPKVDKVSILVVSHIPQSPESMDRLSDALSNARHLNIRLVLPRGRYPGSCRINIDS